MRVSRPESSGVGPAGVAVVVVLLLLALLPTRLTGWVTAFRGPLQAVVGPVSGPLSVASSAVRPSERLRREADAGAEELLRQRDRYELLLRQANRRVAQLEARLESLEGWRAATGGAVRARWGRVIGRDLELGTITVRVGGGSGVPVGSVVVDSSSRQLVGRVVLGGPGSVVVRLVTTPVEGPTRWLRCVVFPGEEAVVGAPAQAQLPRVDLSADGGGVLRSAPAGEHPALRAGAVARVDDPTWPEPAQLLVVGRVSSSRESGSPLMREVTVEPMVEDLGGLASVVVLVPGDGVDVGGGDRGRSGEGG